MTTMTKDAAFWSKVSRKYADMPVRNQDGYLQTLERSKSYLRPEDAVLEIGCGTGSTALLLAPHVARITGTDIAPGMIEIARERQAEAGLENVQFTVAGVAEHPDAAAPYDAVMAHNLLHLLPDLDAGLSRIRSLVKPGGLFISKTVCAPDRPGLRYAAIRWVVVPVLQALGKAPVVRFVSAETLEARIAGAGFEIVETGDQQGVLPSHYVVARKL